jgi:acyl transferase domain-containing protein/NADPH:quinone reductase-like Zn-dependent oxidoreductase/NAD(P)-dependent dehydrogenase (short-subunit alcohol dehydrogenase family)/acyl carrier protein
MNTRKEPIAIIGIGCRFPGGASNPRLFWRNLCQGKDAITEVPPERWDTRKFYDPDPDKPGKSYVKQGGFLKERIDEFDPLFFGISPREAETMDPQQRLLLEVAWEAFEDAGILVDELAGSNTGVYIGGFMLDNMLMSMGPLNRELVNTHTPTSSTMTILANRLSYIFDLHGPSMTVDTACSSSLVACHYACQGIWCGDCGAAICGGVNVMLRPEYPIAMSKGHFLSAHGRCMAFDERAAGYARGEGAGIVILKPLSAALAHNDRIYALINMTGVNQDGHTQGISMPNADAQAALMRSVYQQSGVNPGAVGYIEAHGTGTQAGDPKEAQALDAVLAEGRPHGLKCLIGSVKTNIGHLEAGAGIAGLIKAALCVQQGIIPPSLHFTNPNPAIPFNRLCVEVVSRTTDWPAGYDIRYAGVNSFGYGGTNAHVLLREPPSVDDAESQHEAWNRPLLLPVSARSETALAALAGRYSFHLSTLSDPRSVADFFYTAALRRSHHRNRLAVYADTIDDLRDKLLRFSEGNVVEGLSAGECEHPQKPGPVFIYTGMGPQWWCMGRELMEKEPVFRDVLMECDGYFVKVSGWSVFQALRADEKNSRMARTEVAQPANFILQIALTALWETWGIKPGAVIGHSVGEVSAAYVSGALSLKDAVNVSYHRSRLQATTAGQGGGMLAAGLREPDAIEVLKGFDRVSIAAINSPVSVTLSGDTAQLNAIAGKLSAANVFNRFLQVEVAYHSGQMDPIEKGLLASLDKLDPRPTRIPMYSTVTGDCIEGMDLDSGYWWRNVREPVRFAQGVRSLLLGGFKHFVEIGPHPVLGHSVKETAAEENTTVSLFPSLNRQSPELKSMLVSLGQLYASGFTPNWQALIPPHGRLVSLPNYPWQRERYWLESEESIQDRLGQEGNVFLNTPMPSPVPMWTVEINDQFFPYLNDHRVNGEIVFPGAGYVEAGLAVFDRVFESQPLTLADVALRNMLLVEPGKVQILATTYDESNKYFHIYSRNKEAGSEWRLNASGRLIPDAHVMRIPDIDVPAFSKTFTAESASDALYDMLARRRLEYGPCFQNTKRLWRSEDQFLAWICAEHQSTREPGEYLLHPIILDAALHSLLVLVPGNVPFVPVSMERIVLFNRSSNPCYCHGILTNITSATLTADFYFYDEQGAAFAEVKNCFSRALGYLRDERDDAMGNYFYAPAWVEKPDIQSDTDIRMCLLFSDGSPSADAVETDLTRKNMDFYKVSAGVKFDKVSSHHYAIDADTESDYVALLRDVNHGSLTHVVYLWPLPADQDETRVDGVCALIMRLLYLVRALAGLNKEIILIIITRGAQVVSADQKGVNLSTSPLWGLGPLISNEYPNIRYRLIDVDPDRESEPIAGYLFNNASDLAVRDRRQYIKQIEKLPYIDESETATGEPVSTEHPVMMEQLKPGRVESIGYRLADRAPPGDMEVEIKIEFTGLNFKDVLKIYNSIPEKVMEQTYFGTAAGMEIAGKIVRIGSGVGNFSVGDEVIAGAKDCFRSYATVPVKFVWKKPKSLKPEESLFYITFATAYHALVDTAKLHAGESVLIHSAAGALGLAAVQIAQWIGADIFATASTEEKRQYLLALGIKHVMNSRTISFTDEIRSSTRGRGIDVVINALPGEMLRQSLNALAPYGRFIEVGKSDIAANSGLPMAAFNRNLSFSSVDFDRMHLDRPDEVDRLVRLVVQGFDAGYFKPFPVKVFRAAEVADAFRYMAQARHIGKIVVKYDSETVNPRIEKNKNIYKRDGAYLIAGGTSGFGLEVAKRLSEKSVGRIILISRKGAATPECTEALGSIRDKGVSIEAHAVDITNANSTAAFIARLKQATPPLRGIINSAMVLDDAYVKDLDVQRLRDVLAPKVAGTMNLYHCTKDLALDFFVSFSSISSWVGNPGQANYVAANGFLDEFAHAARLKSFPAITINWGALAESGVVARNNDLNKFLEQEGITGLTNEEALAAMDWILTENKPQVGVFKIDWKQWGKMHPQGVNSSRFQASIKAAGEIQPPGTAAQSLAVITILKEMPEAERLVYIAEVLRRGMAKILKLSMEKIKLDQNLNKLGIDSLMLLELSLAIRDEFGVDITAMELFKQTSIQQLANEIRMRLALIETNYNIN